jgi:predicted dehydrogenase
MLKIRIAFIGAGNMTTEHMKAFADIDEVAIAGICSKTRTRAEKLAELYPGTIVCDSIEELYTKTKADIVVVSVPELVVTTIAIECFKFPWICLFEKPLGLGLAEAIQVSEAAKKTSSTVFVLLNRRHYSSTRKVLEDINQIPGGRMIHVQDQEDIKLEQEKGVSQLMIKNWMYANAIHVIDYFCFLGRGEITRVENIVSWNPSNPQHVIAKIEYASGDMGLYQAVWNAPAPWIVAVNTPTRRWEMKPLEQASYQDYRTRKSNSVATATWDTQFKPGLRQQAQEAINAYKGLPHTMPTIDDSLVTMQLVHKIYGV